MRSFLQVAAAWVIITTINMTAQSLLKPSPSTALIMEILFICGSLVVGFVTYRVSARQALVLRILLRLLVAGATYASLIVIGLALTKPD